MPDMSEDLTELKAVLEEQHRSWAFKKHLKESVLKSMESTLFEIKNHRPNDRSELDRRYAVTITDFEKVMAYFKTYIVDEYMLGGTSQPPTKSDE